MGESRGIDVIENDEPVDLSVALNQGLDFFLRQEDIRYIGWIHNDMTFYSRWLKRLVALLETHPGVGKLAPDSMHLYGPNDPDQAERIMAAHQGDMRTGNACPWIMPKEVARKTGYFDERFVSCGGYEDWDYNNRLLEFGYDVMITKASLVWHPTMGTRKHRDLSRAAEKNAEWYYRKWGTYAPRV